MDGPRAGLRRQTTRAGLLPALSGSAPSDDGRPCSKLLASPRQSCAPHAGGGGGGSTHAAPRPAEDRGGPVPVAWSGAPADRAGRRASGAKACAKRLGRAAPDGHPRLPRRDRADGCGRSRGHDGHRARRLHPEQRSPAAAYPDGRGSPEHRPARDQPSRAYGRGSTPAAPMRRSGASHAVATHPSVARVRAWCRRCLGPVQGVWGRRRTRAPPPPRRPLTQRRGPVSEPRRQPRRFATAPGGCEVDSAGGRSTVPGRPNTVPAKVRPGWTVRGTASAAAQQPRGSGASSTMWSRRGSRLCPAGRSRSARTAAVPGCSRAR